uniref:Uncharacterized protein n=1 Tax=Quercus lobata TaxID=97700 RepID=A0A7N2RCZ2_QUELO
MAGQDPPLRAFLADQLSDEIENPTEEKQKEIDDRTNILWRVARRLEKAAIIDERTPPVSRKEQELLGHLCTAEQVEAHRLYLIEEENIDPMDSNQTISMSVLWLFPQFILLGLMEGLATDGLQEFFDKHVALSMRGYGPPFNECVLVVMYAYASYSLKSFHMGNASEDEELNEILVRGTDGLTESRPTRSVSFPIRRRNVDSTATEYQRIKSVSLPLRSISLRLKDKKVGESAANVEYSPEHMEEPLLQSHASTEAEEGFPADDKPESHHD